MHFPQISLIALLVVIVADFTNAASIKKTETLDKQNMQEKVGKNPDEEQAAVEAKEPEKGSDIDQDGNGKIGEEEYTAFLKRREEEYQNELREGLQQTLKDFDKNEDGKLEEEEIVQLLAATRNLRPKASFKPAFAELDSDNDGGLNVDELEFFLQHTPWNLLEEIPSSEMMS